MIHWGICGTGRIAAKFAADLRFVPGAVLAAVGSRSRAAAEEFGRRFEVARVHEGYERQAADETVDVVYVATPQSRHHADVLAFLAAGKAVLCEKPFAMTAAQAAEMVSAARAAGLFLMEAMWTRFLPIHHELRRLLADGAIGAPHLLSADFGYRVAPGSAHRLLDPALGGGSLLDIGVYPVSLAVSLFGVPTRVAALAGTDPVARVDSGCASTSGVAGRITIERPFHAATELTVHTPAGVSRISRPFDGVGLHFEAAEVMDCLRDGRPESDVMPLAETLDVMATLDRIRADARSGGPSAR